MSATPKSKIKPMPLFDTLKAFLSPFDGEYEADRPAIVEYIRQFEPEIPAMSDYKAVRDFLKSYSKVQPTFNSYRSQVERLMLWAWIKRGKSVLTLTRTDAEAFMNFCASPDASWVGKAVVVQRFTLKGDVFEPNESWFPYVAQVKKSVRKNAEEKLIDTPKPQFTLSQSSVRQVLAVCSSFYDFLLKNDIKCGNPFRAIGQKSSFIQRDMRVVEGRALSHLQWEYIVETAEQMAKEDPKKHERSLFIVVTLMAMYLRVSDLVGNSGWKPTMGSFVLRGENWWYESVGKGNVKASITVKPDYLQYLARYRRSRSLPDLPSPGETTPLITTIHGRGGLTDRQVRSIVQEVFDKAFNRMLGEGRSEAEVSSLRSASLHWLRHTGATFDAPYRDPKHLQADLRHKNLSTTQDIYYNSIDEERARSASGLTIRRDG